MAQRSRQGCWTCKKRHKKCDEARPQCQRCVKAGLSCAGYEVRLTWGCGAKGNRPGTQLSDVASKGANSSSMDSTINATAGDDTIGHHQFGAMLELPAISPGSLDCLLLQFGHEAEDVAYNLSLDDDTAQQLIGKFAAKGHLTLAGRSGHDSLLKTHIIPMCASSTPLRHASIAYQASLDDDTAHLTPLYMQSALSHYLHDLSLSDRLQLDSTLAAGVLLCSISINCMYVWTPLLIGLHGVLQHRGLLADGAVSQHSPVALHLFEVIALMDIDCFTVNRRGKPMKLWKQYLSLDGSKSMSIEQTSGLPYSLITILADLEAPSAEQKLQHWTGAVGDELVEIQLWDAFRHAGILHARALLHDADSRTPSAVGTTQDSLSISPQCGPPVTAKILRLRALACIQAIIDSGAFTFRDPLFRGLLYPLYIVGVLCEGLQERRVIRVAFSHLDEPGQQTAVSKLVFKSWDKSGALPNDAAKLAFAAEIAAEDKVEIHLT